MEKILNTKEPFRAVLHGSFRKHFEEIKRTSEIFRKAGIEIIAPEISPVKSIDDGFAVLESDKAADKRMIELLYLHNLKRLGENGFSYFVNPEGYIGKSASYELGIAQISNVRCFFSYALRDHPAYLHGNSVWKPELLAEYIKEFGCLPKPEIKKNEKAIHRLWEELIVPGSIVAVGGIIEFRKPGTDRREILLVKTHKWGGRFSIVGGRVRRSERMSDALLREIREETGLRGEVKNHICTLDQIKNSGYYQKGTNYIFVDNVVEVGSRKVRLNEEAEEFAWMSAEIALRDLNIEPNARHTLELYSRMAAAA